MERSRPHWRRWEDAASRTAAISHAPVLAGLLLGFLAAAQALLQQHPALPGIAGTSAVLILMAAATTVPLGLLWVQQKVSAVVLTGAALVAAGLPGSYTVAGFAALVVAVWRLGYRRAPLLAAGIAAAFLVAALADLGGRVTAIMLVAGPPLAALAGYVRRAGDDAAAGSAEREAMSDSLVKHAARGERARIARELHDVVAHHISMIAVQAETARLTTPGISAAGAQRLSAIGDTARSALTEMRRLLGVLREDTTEEHPRRDPQPSLSQLNALVDEARDASGAGTRLIISGWLATLEPGVELAAYRIIQEALTNARRHAPGAAVDVELRYEPDRLSVRIRDNGPGPAGDADVGHGLQGMRERAAAVGGSLRTGVSLGGGFLVEASLPVQVDEAVAC
ncbi:MAG TPA: sensor histidine kinase [Streptosporangiaceae bacterium]|nr:sensor histidine kinase [Streptosporangiaceae bacterium]